MKFLTETRTDFSAETWGLLFPGAQVVMDKVEGADHSSMMVSTSFTYIRFWPFYWITSGSNSGIARGEICSSGSGAFSSAFVGVLKAMEQRLTVFLVIVMLLMELYHSYICSPMVLNVDFLVQLIQSMLEIVSC